MYSLVKDSKVFLGPVRWNKSMFTAMVLKNKFTGVTIPKIECANCYDAGGGVKIYPTEIVKPSYDPMTQYLEGPSFNINEDKVVATWIVRDTEFEFIKGNYKEVVTKNRYVTENQGVDINIGEAEVNVPTTRDFRLELANVLVSMTEESTVDYKLNDQWFAFNKTELNSLIVSIENHVQAAFSKEKELHDKINACTTVDEIKAIDISF